jgi:hypothetical protein
MAGSISLKLARAALALTLSSHASAQQAKAPEDIGLDFEFLRVGLTRKAVVDRLGAPNAQSKSETLAVTQRKLTWVDPEGQRYVASFLFDRLWRWKKCSATATDC